MRLIREPAALAVLLALALGALAIAWIPGPEATLIANRASWVPTHTLAIIRNAVAEQGFVGHALVERGAHGVSWIYFDRYPVVFSALARALLWLGDPTGLEVYRRSLWVAASMTALLMLSCCWLLVRLGLSRMQAAAAAILVFGGHVWLEYRQLFHFDIPGLLALSLVWHGLITWYRERRFWPMLAAALVGVATARGFVTLSTLAAWGLVEAWGLARVHHWRPRPVLRGILRHPALHISLLAANLLALSLAWNLTWAEATAGRDRIEMTITRSAQRRLATIDWSGARAWDEFLLRQGRLFAENATPYALFEGMVALDPPEGQAEIRMGDAETRSLRLADVGSFAWLAILAALAWVGWRRWRQSPAAPPGLPQMLLILLLSAPLWSIPFKGLTAGHKYTILHTLGALLVLTAAATALVPRRGQPWLLAGALLLLLIGVPYSETRIFRPLFPSMDAEARDLDRIHRLLPPGIEVGLTSTARELTPWAGYAPGLLLDGRRFVVPRPPPRRRRDDPPPAPRPGLPPSLRGIEPGAVASLWPDSLPEYWISRTRWPATLTPKNQRLFLYRLEDLPAGRPLAERPPPREDVKPR